MAMDVRLTNRGFGVSTFEDANGVTCSIQESSAVPLDEDDEMIWLGCDTIGLKRFTPHQGWEDVELEQDHPYGITHVANTRMHLTRDNVRDLLPLLAHFAEHGTLPTNST